MKRVRKRACFGNVSLFKVIQKGKQKSCRRNFSLQEDSQQHHQRRRKKDPEKILFSGTPDGLPVPQVQIIKLIRSRTSEETNFYLRRESQ